MTTTNEETTNGTNGTTNEKVKLPRGHKPPPAHLAEEVDDTVELVKIDPKTYAPKVIAIDLVIEEITPLIINKFSTKSQTQMLEAQMQTVKKKREPKDPVALFEGAKHKDEQGRDCLHAASIRNAMISAARGIDGITMASLKQAIFVEGPEGPKQNLLPIKYDKCVMRQDAVRNDSGTADLRFRPCYEGWSVDFRLVILKNVISVAQALQLVELAGFSCGVGEWRPAGKTGLGGSFGRFRIRPPQS